MPKYEVGGFRDFFRGTYFLDGAGSKAQAFYSMMQQHLQKGGYPIEGIRVESQKMGFFGKKRDFLKVSAKGLVAQVYAYPYGDILYVNTLVVPEKGFKIGKMKLFAAQREELNAFQLQDLEMFSHAIDKVVKEILEAL